ncbi:MAG TPA: oligopeptide transporter, OPT family [Verrucomicrobiae bacterium]|nr:oligopeptide transporter, OPT family [Verrucomicrobiae bacterium]
MTRSGARDGRVELTLRGLLLGAGITLVFTAANVYLGLKAGLTFASSIPAAVISMAALRAFRNASIYENNIVQTVASAAGTLSSVIFVLPGLVMVGWWNGFPFWESFGICAVGGILGVMYTIPLRRALVTQSDLPYPEGVAAAEVLRVGSGGAAGEAEGKTGLLAVAGGAVASAAFAAIAATKIFTSEVDAFFRAGAASTGIGFGLSFALLGAGHLVGLAVGLAMFCGYLIAWGVATPILTALHPIAGSAGDVATAVWSHQVRFIGAGAIGVSALWTLGKLAVPVYRGLLAAIEASRRSAAGEGDRLPRTERDLPIGVVAFVSVALLVPLAVLFAGFLRGGPLAGSTLPLVLGAIAYVVVVGFLVAAVCGYMAGLIGSSNSPVSGLAILAVLGIALLLALFAGSDPKLSQALVALALFVTAVVLNVATIANDNLQDLKTGQLVDATPSRQQVALIVGVVFGALVIPPILDLLNRAYGFAGAPALHGAAGAQPLPAPQATLISALAQGVIGGHLDWGLIGAGALVGAGLVVLDEVLRATTRYKLPPLAVGIGMYLPPATTLPVALGALIGWCYNRLADRRGNGESAKRLGVLLASGLIVGESLFGVLLAGLIAGSGNGAPLALVGARFAGIANWLGPLAFAALAFALYRWISRRADASAALR